MDTHLCEKCHLQIPEERAQFLIETERPLTCILCSQEQSVVGFQVYPHKTGSFCVVIKPNDEESLRRAQRANRRSR